MERRLKPCISETNSKRRSLSMKTFIVPLSFLFVLMLSIVLEPPPSAARNSNHGVLNAGEAIERRLFAEAGRPSQDKPSQSATRKEAFNALISKAQSEGSVRVIVGLRVSGFRAEGHLRNAEAVKVQRQDIARAQAQIQDLLEPLALNVTSVRNFEFIPFIAMTVDAAALQQLRISNEVASIEEDIAVAPSLAESVPLIGAPAAWAAGYTGAGQTVAILDTGVDK